MTHMQDENNAALVPTKDDASATEVSDTDLDTPSVAVEPEVLKKALVGLDGISKTMEGQDLLDILATEFEDDNNELLLAATDEFSRRVRAFDLYMTMFDLLTTEPFYAAISRKINKVRTMRLPTAAVTIMNDMFILMWNPSFMTRIAPDHEKAGAQNRLKVTGVLMHEYLHLILRHCTDRAIGLDYPVLANWAMDLSINGMIPREKLPDGLIIPGEELSVPPDAATVYRPKDLEQWIKMGGFIKGLPKNQSAEAYYSALLQWIIKNAPEIMEDPDWGKPQEDDQDGGGQGGSQSCSCGDEHGDESGVGEGQASGEGQGEGEGEGDGQGKAQGKGKGKGKGHGQGQGEGEGQGESHDHGDGQPCNHDHGAEQGNPNHNKAKQSPGRGAGPTGGTTSGQGQSPGNMPAKPDPSCPVHGKKRYSKGRAPLGQFDDHSKWDEISDADRDFIRQRVKSMLREAVNEADNCSSGWGSIPADMQATLRRLISDQIDWRALLKQFVGYSQHMNHSSTIKRINRRYPYIHPGTKRGHGATLWIYIDQSGSVGNDDIALLFGELDQLAKKVNFRVFFFDTEVDEDFIDWRRGQKHPAKRRRCGGTDFNAPTEHANQHHGEMDGYLIMTDGECSQPRSTRTKRAWVIVPNQKLMFETDELIIQMERPATNSIDV